VKGKAEEVIKIRGKEVGRSWEEERSYLG